ncbi:MAG: hypothetical protein QNK15_09835 [Cycloclasticus sp.]|jgi:hypothetical protein|nr:hypothetical protein [Cycloclasticus sp.]|tara:strand:+ start:1957 stop:2574 length:618 start_codon:yes stop_codon:yes gene_type:complete
MYSRNVKGVCLIAWTIVLTACATTPPKNQSDVCSIFYQQDDWYADALKSEKKWGTPIAVQMAIIHQESRFQSDVRPPRDWFLGIIPKFRSSSAYGYGQAQDSTWEWYMKSTDNYGADRDDFADVVDFIGWYTNVTQRKLGVSKWHAEQQYLAYHEGHGGYSRGTYLGKPWLQRVAKKVGRQAKRYASQLKSCESSLDSGWSIWPF